MSKIGTLNEKALHASLKEWYANPEDQIEVKVDGFFIDIVQGDLLIEIQTGNFGAMKRKLKKLLRSHRVRLVYPVAREKWIVKLASYGSTQLSTRKSPKKGRVEELFGEMVSFPELLAHPNFSIEVVLTREEEIRRFEKNKNWRRKGWGIVERRLLEVVDQVLFENPADWLSLLPEGMREFTVKDLSKKLKLRKRLAQKMAYCLRKANVIELIGKEGRAYLYRVVDI
ncbi:MAG: hypothetical protein GY755_22985 [Chloroflexi bacterium]|nr:hypothetical protein [Chloroflexota bacterium]